jgi:hypothetical protein
MYIGSLFQMFQFMVTCITCFWTHGVTEHHGKEYVVEQSSSLHGSQKAER